MMFKVILIIQKVQPFKAIHIYKANVMARVIKVKAKEKVFGFIRAVKISSAHPVLPDPKLLFALNAGEMETVGHSAALAYQVQS